MKRPGIYRLDWESGYFYIGQAQHLLKRWIRHKQGFKNGHMKKHQLKLYNVWKKHGTPKFTPIIYCPTELLNSIEQVCININWGSPMLCNTSPSSINCRGVKRSKPPWNKGIPMTEARKVEHSIAVKGLHEGIKHPMVKLTEKEVIEIREKYTPFKVTAKILGLEYGVDKGQILRIVNNKSWKHIPSADIEKNKELVRTEGFITHNGISKNLKQWAQHLGIDYLTLYQRVKKYGFTFEEAIKIQDNVHMFTADQIREIRSKYVPKIYGSVVLGKEYGVSHNTILNIVKRKIYKDVD